MRDTAAAGSTSPGSIWIHFARMIIPADFVGFVIAQERIRSLDSKMLRLRIKSVFCKCVHQGFARAETNVLEDVPHCGVVNGTTTFGRGFHENMSRNNHRPSRDTCQASHRRFNCQITSVYFLNPRMLCSVSFILVLVCDPQRNLPPADR